MFRDFFQVILNHLEGSHPLAGSALFRQVKAVRVTSAQAGPGIKKLPNSGLEKVRIFRNGLGKSFKSRQPPVQHLGGHRRPQQVPLLLDRLEKKFLDGPRVGVVLVPDEVMQELVAGDQLTVDVALYRLVPVAVEVAAGRGAVRLPASEADPTKVKVTLVALDVIATVGLLKGQLAVGTLTRVVDQPADVVPASVGGRGRLFALGQPLLPDGTRERSVSLGSAAIPTEEMKLSTLDSAREGRHNLETFFPQKLFSVRHLDHVLTIRVGTVAHRRGVDWFLEKVLFKLQVLSRHSRRHVRLDDLHRHQDVALARRAGHVVGPAHLDLVVEVVLPTSGAEVVTATQIVSRKLFYQITTNFAQEFVFP